MSTPVSTSGDAIATMVKNLKAMRSDWRTPIILAQVRELSRREQMSILEEIGREIFSNQSESQAEQISEYFKREAEADRELVRRYKPTLDIPAPVKSAWPFAHFIVGATVVLAAVTLLWLVIPFGFWLWSKVGR